VPAYRYTLHLDRLQRDWARIEIDHIRGQIPRPRRTDAIQAAWSYLRDNAAGICEKYATEHGSLKPSDLMIGKVSPSKLGADNGNLTVTLIQQLSTTIPPASHL
jgi:hypothetical protein